jgi:ligand-binding sensor domain-containing protein
MKPDFKIKESCLFYECRISGIIKILCFLSALHLILPFNLHARGHGLVFEEISIEQGLSQSIVFCIIQDQKGFMWFGTEDGLNKYDGYTFTVYRHDPNQPNSLSYNEIRTIYEDSSGVLWIGTFYGGLNKFDAEKELFIHYQNDPDDPNSLSHNNVKTVFEDRLGVLWIGTEGGLNKFNRKTGQFTRYLSDPNNPNSLSHNVVRAIYQDQSGLLWIATEGGLNKFDRETETVTRGV